MGNQTRVQIDADIRLIEEIRTRLDFVDKGVISAQKALDGLTYSLVQRQQQFYESINETIVPALNGKEASHGS